MAATGVSLALLLALIVVSVRYARLRGILEAGGFYDPDAVVPGRAGPPARARPRLARARRPPPAAQRAAFSRAGDRAGGGELGAGICACAQQGSLPGLAGVAVPARLPGGASRHAAALHRRVHAQLRGRCRASGYAAGTGASGLSRHPGPNRRAPGARHRHSLLRLGLRLSLQRALRADGRRRGRRRPRDVGHLVRGVVSQRHHLGGADAAS